MRIGGGGVVGSEPLSETVKGLGRGREGEIGPEGLGESDVDLRIYQTGVCEKGIGVYKLSRDNRNLGSQWRREIAWGVQVGMLVCFSSTSRVVWSSPLHRILGFCHHL